MAIDGLRVIHLIRRNILRSHVSREIAFKIENWKQSHDEKMPLSERRVRLDKEECLKAFQETRSYQLESPKIFKGRKVIDVHYEDIVANPQVELSKIQDFLGLKPAKLSVKSRKRNPKKLSDLIINYAELKKGFEGTEWAGFFED